jgi:hypothetical protein
LVLARGASPRVARDHPEQAPEQQQATSINPGKTSRNDHRPQLPVVEDQRNIGNSAVCPRSIHEEVEEDDPRATRLGAGHGVVMDLSTG